MAQLVILVVDDESMIRRMVKSLPADEGYFILAAPMVTRYCCLLWANMGRILGRVIGVMRGRVLLYALAFPGAVALGILTPLDFADWLIEVVLVWCASSFGSRREMRVVFIVGCVTVFSGLCPYPASTAPFWIGTLNRLAAIAVMWTMVNTSEQRRAAEEAERKAEAKIKILRGFLPICCVCKSMKSTDGTWHKLEAYLTANSEVRLTHGFCPSCAVKAMDQLAADRASL